MALQLLCLRLHHYTVLILGVLFNDTILLPQLIILAGDVTQSCHAHTNLCNIVLNGTTLLFYNYTNHLHFHV